jgi:excisionase family DNA binding protein
MEHLLTTQMAADYLGLSLYTIRSYVWSGIIKSTKFGHQRVIDKKDLDEFKKNKQRKVVATK